MNNNIIEDIKTDALKRYIPIIKDETLEILMKYIRENDVKNVLEIGTAVGYSSIEFLNHLSNSSMITTIEREKEMFNEATQNFLKFGKEVDGSDKNMKCFEIDNKFVNLINGDAVEILPKLNSKFDMIFIDANKSKYPFYLEQGLRLLNKNGTIFADNVLFKGMVLSDYNEHKHRTNVRNLRDFLNKIKDEKLDSKVLEIGDGLAIIKFK